MNSYSDLHSQRPEYQRVGIDLAYGYVQNYMARIGVSYEKLVNTEKVFILNSDFVLNGPLKSGLYVTFNDSVYIKLSLFLAFSPLVHELIHAFSSSHRRCKKEENLSTGFSQDIYSENAGQHIATNNGFNEGITTSIQKIIGKQNEIEILKYQKRYSEIQRRIHALLKYEGKKTYESNFYSGYREEVGFIQVFIDTLCYIRLKGKDRDFEEERKKIWKELERAFFTGDIKWLESACHEIDRIGGLQKEVEISPPSNEIFSNLTQKLIFHTRENFNSLYIPTTL